MSRTAVTKQRLRVFDAEANGAEARLESFMGREYTVIPVIALVQGVLQASNSSVPELALATEFGKVPAGWNGRPIVMGHPKDDEGNPISANSPATLEKYSFGFMFNTSLKNNAANKASLYTEAWLDNERVREMGGAPARVLERINAKEVIEVSTGLFSVSIDEEGVYDGKEYAAKWTEVVPDHLAILNEGSTGACSVEDGCGAMRTMAGGSNNDQTAPAQQGPATPDLMDVLFDQDCGFVFEDDDSTDAGDDDTSGVHSDEDDFSYTFNPGSAPGLPDGQNRGITGRTVASITAYMGTSPANKKKRKPYAMQLQANCDCGGFKFAAKKAKEPYGDVEYADPGYQKDKKKRYPIDTAEHIRAAWNYINQKKNAAKYSSSQVSSIKRKIVAAWKSKINKSGPPGAKNNAAYNLCMAPFRTSVLRDLLATSSKVEVAGQESAAAELRTHEYPADMTSGDVYTLLSLALQGAFIGRCYLVTFSQETCIFGYSDPDTWDYTTYSVPYTLDDSGAVTFSGQATEVVLLTRVVPVTDADATASTDDAGRPALTTQERTDMTQRNAGAAAEATPAATTTATPGAAVATPAATETPAATVETPAATAETRQNASTPAVRALTTAEYIAQAPEDVRAVLEEGLRLQTARKAALVGELKANARNEYSEAELNALDLKSLERIAKLARTPNFSAQGAGQAGQSPDEALRDNAAPQAPPKIFENGKAAPNADPRMYSGNRVDGTAGTA